MIAFLTGRLLEKTTQAVIVDIHGIGYEVVVPLSTFYELPEPDGEVSLFIHTHVREDALILFGFNTPLEKRLFLLLVSVSGIGPKLAVNILSGIGPGDLLNAMIRGDAARIQAAPGVGKKTAERITLELKDKAAALADEIPSGPGPAVPALETDLYDDAVSALTNLGYSLKAAKQAVEKGLEKADRENLQDIIREALKVLA